MPIELTQRLSAIRDRIGDIQARFETAPVPGGFGALLDRLTPPAPAPAAEPAAAAAPSAKATGAGAAAAAGSLAGLVSSAARKQGLDPALVDAVVRVESNYNPTAVSPVGAQGLMQLMPGTAAALGVTDPRDPRQNVEGGTKYLAEQIRRFGLENGVAAYNAGPGAVQKHGGVPPYAETQAYVQKVLALYRANARPETGGKTP